MREITVTELKTLMDEGKDFQLIDVREQNEYDFANLGGEHIPLATVLDNADRIDTERMVVVHCRSGKRSGQAIELLERHFGYDNLYNLEGGILAWSDQIDPEVPKY